jgi:uncharacterized membrane-anchored protein
MVAAPRMSLLLISLLLGPPNGDLGGDPEVIMREALGQADPAQVAAMEALSRVDPRLLERLEAMDPAELEALMGRRLRGETLSPEDEALVQANVSVSVAGFDSLLSYQSASIELASGLGHLQLGDDLRFLDAQDARRVLTEAWGNPAKDDTIGMLVPGSHSVVHPFEGWGIRVAYRADGWVDDADAADFDPEAALAELKRQVEGEDGRSMRVVGWARAPEFDATEKVMSWGVEYAPADETLPHSLNYVSRVLTRGGVLEFSSVANDAQRELIVATMAGLPAQLQLAEGQAHADFDAEKDPQAPYTVADLMRGGAGEVDGWSGLKRLGPLLVLGIVAWVLSARRRRRESPTPSR